MKACKKGKFTTRSYQRFCSTAAAAWSERRLEGFTLQNNLVSLSCVTYTLRLKPAASFVMIYSRVAPRDIQQGWIVLVTEPCG